MKKRAVRFNVYLRQEDYDAMVKRSKEKKSSYAETLRQGLLALKKQDELVEALSDGKHLIIEDPKTGKKIRVLILGLE